MSILIIKKNKGDIFFNKITETDIEEYYNCKDKNLFFRINRKFQTPFFSLFFGKWKNNIDKYEKIILFDNGFSNSIAKFIKKKNKKVKLILWFWNPVVPYGEQFLNNKYIDEIWTYDKNDAKKYNLKYNTQFYLKKIDNKKDVKIKQDIIFLGRDKGREKVIENIREICEKDNIKSKINIIKNKKDFVEYDDYLQNLIESKAILEIVPENVIGLTIRTMEALFFNKKLITNNKDIKNYDFYNPNNIFIIGEDSEDKMKQFINSPFELIDRKIVEYYDFENWIKRFKE